MRIGLLLIILFSAFNSYAQFSPGYRKKMIEKYNEIIASQDTISFNEDNLPFNPNIGKNTSLEGMLKVINLNMYDKCSRYSTNCQSASIGFGAISAGLLIGYGCLSEKFEINKNEKVKMTGKAKGLVIGGSICAAAAIGLQIASIQYKIKAGKFIQLHLDGSGANMVYVF